MSSVDALTVDNPMSEEQKQVLKENGVAPETSNSAGEPAPSSTVNVFPSDERQKGHYGLSDPEQNPYKPLPVDSATEQQEGHPSGDAVSDDEKYHDAQGEDAQPTSSTEQHTAAAARSSDSFRSSSSAGKPPLEDANISRSSDDIRKDSSVPFEASEPVQLERITEAAGTGTAGSSADTAGTDEDATGGTKAVSFEPIKLNPVNVTSGDSSSERIPVTDTEPESRHEQPSATDSRGASSATAGSSSSDTYTDDASKTMSVSDAPHPPHAEAMAEALEGVEPLRSTASAAGSSSEDRSVTAESNGVTGESVSDDAPRPHHGQLVSEMLEQQEQVLQQAEDAEERTAGGDDDTVNTTTVGSSSSAADSSTLSERATEIHTIDAADTSNMDEVNLNDGAASTAGAAGSDETGSTISVERGEAIPSTAAVTASPAPTVRDLPPAPSTTSTEESRGLASPADQAPTVATVESSEAGYETSNESDDEPQQPTVQVPAQTGAVSKGDPGEGIRHTIRDTPQAVKAKVDELDAIREFEAKRTEYYGNQIRAHTIYWVAMKEMIKRRGTVTERLLDWYSKRLNVYKHFAEGLFERNDVMAGDKKGASMQTAMYGNPFSSRAEPLQQKHYKKGDTLRPLGAAGAAEGAGALQDELCAMDCNIATMIEQMCAYLESKVGSVLAQQHADTQRETQALIKEGDHALSTLEQVEAYTLKAYEARHRTAAESMVRPTEYMEHSQGAARRENSGDMWLADTNYRVAVAQQKAAWDNVATLMGSLFDKLRDQELERRKYTRNALEEMLRMQTETWQKLPSTHDPVHTCLGRIDVDPYRLEKDLKDETRMWATSEQAQAYNAPPVSELEGDSPPRQTNPEFITSLSDPLASPFVLDAAVLKRKDKGVMKSSWVSTLVVLTADHYLHMFDCPTLLPGSDPQEAFGAILPAIDPNEKFNADKDDRKAAVLPTQSLDLSSHMIGPRGKQTKAEHAMQFHIIEVQENSGLKRLIKSQSQHKCSLRTRTTAEMRHWMDRIASLCDPKTASAPVLQSGGSSSEPLTVPEVPQHQQQQALHA